MKKHTHRLNNESGMIMVMVLLIVMALMVLSASILSTNLNQNLVTRAQIDDVRCKQIVAGQFLKDQNYANAHPNTLLSDINHPPVVIDGKTYTIQVNRNGNQYQYVCSH